MHSTNSSQPDQLSQLTQLNLVGNAGAYFTKTSSESNLTKAIGFLIP
ncbi:MULTISPECIES: hypothetical protein [unclassified Corynebacterium]|nr:MULTISPECIES: hypothetical protein [unclassified Corynebacterium]